MSPDVALIITAEPKLAQWQLPRVRSGRTVLIGWRTPADDLESRVPAAIANVIAHALTRVARVTFPTSTPPKAAPADAVDVLESHGFRQRLMDWRSRTPARIYLVSTRTPQSVLMVFDDGGFPWWMQGNVALLSAPDEKLQLDRKRLLAIMALDAIDEQVIGSEDLWGVIVPGVDGDMFGIISRDAVVQERLMTALEEQARAMGIGWIVTTEDQFAEQLRP